MTARRLPVLLGDSGNMQRLDHSALAEPAPGQRPRFDHGVARVIDITKHRETLGEGLEVGFSGPIPAALTQLAPEIEAKLRPCGREPSDVTQSKLMQALAVEGDKRAAGFHALFVPHSPTIRNSPAAPSACDSVLNDQEGTACSIAAPDRKPS